MGGVFVEAANDDTVVRETQTSSTNREEHEEIPKKKEKRSKQQQLLVAQNMDRKPPQGRPGGERPRRTSDAFDAFYRTNLVDTGLIEAGSEWESFIDCLNRPLPCSLWITPTAKDADEVRTVLQNYQRAVETMQLEGNSSGSTDEKAGEASMVDGQGQIQLAPLSWMPNDMGWRVDVPKAVLRKDSQFKPLHNILIEHTARGTINRMEEVSMLPVQLLSVGAGHRCLDMCASPGNKTAQILSILAEANFKKWGRGLEDLSRDTTAGCQEFLRGRIDYSLDEGFVIANDISVERSGMLVHQIARHQSLYPLVVFTSHDARFFPSIASPNGSPMELDRILCDVMCSSDGTMRKSPHLWREWTAKLSLELHSDQLSVALRAARLLKVGGRMVYSTCSMSPIENEAVVAELLRCSEGCLHLVDARHEIEPLRTCEGLQQWRVTHPGTRRAFADYASAVEADGDHKLLRRGNFPPPAGSSASLELSKCVRILPHHNDTSGFFIAVFDKIADMKRRSPAQCEQNGSFGVDMPHAYDSDVDEDGEELERQRQLQRLEDAVANGRSDQERAKAIARRERMKNSGCLARELARYRRFTEDMPDKELSVRSFYDLSSQFPADLLFCRYHLELNTDGVQIQPHQGHANQLVFCSRGVANLIACGTADHQKRKLKVMAGGLRAFERDRFEVSERSSSFRFAQEAMEFMLPYLGHKRLVALDDIADTRRLFCPTSKRTAPTAAIISSGRAELESLSPGGCVLLLPTEQGDRIAVSALRTQNAVNLYINDLAVPALRKAFGLPAEIVDKPNTSERESCDLPDNNNDD